jgi:hypothetical protein
MELPAYVYHLAELSNWPSIQKHGLLPSNDLIAESGLSRIRKKVVSTQQRDGHTILPNGVEIRDQLPMPPEFLERCLIGMTPSEWYANLNSRVFFWLDIDRLNRMCKACSGRPQIALKFDVQRILAKYRSKIELAPINTGYARRKPAKRGAATFVPLTKWLRSGWESETFALGTSTRSQNHEPVELTVRSGMPDACDFLLAKTEILTVNALMSWNEFKCEADSKKQPPARRGE